MSKFAHFFSLLFKNSFSGTFEIIILLKRNISYAASSTTCLVLSTLCRMPFLKQKIKHLEIKIPTDEVTSILPL